MAEARTLLDALDREKGAWDPVVEPWRLRLSADALFRSDGAPSKIEATFTGVDALEITVGEAAAAAAAAARSLAAGSESALPPSFSRAYWLHNATNVAAEYELDGDVRGVVQPIRARKRRRQRRLGPRGCLLYTSPSPRDATLSRMPSSA